MYRIKIFSIGKTKESWLQEALQDYEKRLTSLLEIEWILTKNENQLYSLLEKETPFIALTPIAKQPTSEQFSKDLYRWLEKSGSRLSFVIGGPSGLDTKTISRALETVSFSSLTFTHQIIRLLLVEQIYRATEINKGSGYHK